jgi:predicted deacylase
MANSTRILRPRFSTHADGSEAALTIHEIVGSSDGPTIGISGAIHGNEPTGTEIILELYRMLQHTPIKGRLLLLPVANPRAYAQTAVSRPSTS